MQEVTQETFQSDVVEASHERPVLVDFWGPRCGPCLKMMPWVENLATERAADLTVVKVNTTSQKRLGLRLRVMGLPTFVLYRDGEEVARLSGDAATPGGLTRLIEEHVPVSDRQRA